MYKVFWPKTSYIRFGARKPYDDNTLYAVLGRGPQAVAATLLVFRRVWSVSEEFFRHRRPISSVSLCAGVAGVAAGVPAWGLVVVLHVIVIPVVQGRLAEEVVQAAAAVANNFYTMALGSLGDNAERQNLETSHAKFKAYLEDSDQLTALGEALLELPQSPQLGKALRTFVTLQTVLLAGGHADREAVEQALSQILPERVDVVGSSIFHCFKNLLTIYTKCFWYSLSKISSRNRHLELF